LRTGDLSGALTSQRKALEIRGALTASGDGTSQELAASHHRLGVLLATSGDVREAIASYREALALHEAMLAEEPASVDKQLALADAHTRLAVAMRDARDVRAAIEHHRQAMTIRRTVLAGDPASSRAHRDLACSELMLADAVSEAGSTVRGTGPSTDPIDGTAVSRALKTFEALAASDPKSVGAQVDLTFAYHIGAKLLLAARNSAGAMDLAMRAVTTGEAVARRDPQHAQIRRELAAAYARLADAFVALAHDAATPLSARIRNYREARNAHLRTRTILSELQNRGVLAGAERKHLAALPRLLARCDAELAKLEGRATKSQK